MRKAAILWLAVALLSACTSNTGLEIPQSGTPEAALRGRAPIAMINQGQVTPLATDLQLREMFTGVMGSPALYTEFIQIESRHYLYGNYAALNAYLELETNPSGNRLVSGGVYYTCSGNSCTCVLNSHNDCLCSPGTGSGGCIRSVSREISFN